MGTVETVHKSDKIAYYYGLKVTLLAGVMFEPRRDAVPTWETYEPVWVDMGLP